MIAFHKTFITENELSYIAKAIESGHVSGNGVFTRQCQSFFEKKFGFKKCLLTNSCTDALEMCALILNLQPGDEIIMPSYTFVSTANAFVNFGAVPVFIDSLPDEPNLNPAEIESKISPKTRAIVVMHYAGMACDMQPIRNLADKYNLKIIEDAALGLGSKLDNQWLGTLGDLSAFSFHQTKNITCGEGGLLVINNPEFISVSEIIWEKGTNRAAFLRGESEKYEWVSKGSSFLTSEIHAAFLLAQLEKFDDIQRRRIEIWNLYFNAFREIKEIMIPVPNNKITINGSIFFFIFKNDGLIDKFQQFMKENGVQVSTHYRCLHNSNYYKSQFTSEKLIHCQKISENLIRLPLYPDLKDSEIKSVIDLTKQFFNTEIK